MRRRARPQGEYRETAEELRQGRFTRVKVDSGGASSRTRSRSTEVQAHDQVVVDRLVLQPEHTRLAVRGDAAQLARGSSSPT
jgi:excinuclease UvrABC ATPase subunit